MNYLGLTVDFKGVSPDRDRIKAVTLFPTAKNTNEVPSFIGLVGFYNCFVKGFSNKASQLINLIKKDVPFEWRHTQHGAFDTLKHLLYTSIS